MHSVELVNEYGHQNPNIYREAFGDALHTPVTALQAARMAVSFTDNVYPIYLEQTDTKQDAGNCADRASLNHTLLTGFEHLYPTIATFESRAYGTFHFFNAVVDLEDSSAFIIDNSYARGKDRGVRVGTQEIVDIPWKMRKMDDLPIYSPIFRAAIDGAKTLQSNSLLSEVSVSLGRIVVPRGEPGNDDFSCEEMHVHETEVPDEDEAMETGVQILKPTIVTVYNNDESCVIADKILTAA